MALSNILRRSASTVVPLAVRVIGSQRHHHFAALFSAVNHSNISQKLCPTSFPSVLHYSSTSKRPNESLIRVIESEIKCAEESDDHDQVEDIPDGFPFKIQDNPGLQTISLTREYQGESIKVEVHMPDLVTGEEDDDNGDDDDDNEKGSQSSIPLVVSISKKGGPCLEFGCTAFPDEIAIDSLSVKDPENSEDQIAYEGPDFSDLDENLQKAFHKYLEIRGIKPSTTNFLHEYMINKDSKEYLMWLKNLKKFIEA
uniref:Mitochondrial glycoprotein family protein n=1 Tax=Davidia involucrata TaxID=16924 RepID=A0A5B7BWQ4_DAVIN